ncbi:MAG TPA: 16S rRNA (uracil(1498)-N(3))-methyltransferase [Xanthomonadaceae bacterium]|nr:16S rRNA (uracil(1498)-N(3))-methyltransferase [Xanthomonadaceae bacterium]
MRIPRIHADAALGEGVRVELTGAAAEKLIRVLRLRRGDRVVLFNGDGYDYTGALDPLSRSKVAVTIDGRTGAIAESPLRLVLLQALARADKMDWILQKATELGAVGIQPIVSERTEVRLDGERVERRMRHWRGVVQAACEQCGRAVVPTLAVPLPLDALSGESLPPLRLALHPQGVPLRSLDADSMMSGVCIAIGPEGGFSDTDLRLLERIGFRRLGLGPRILRTETAGAAVLAAIQALHGDMG